MPSSEDYLHWTQDQLSQAEGVSWKKMMGEYLLYCHGKLIGGLYDNRLLVKPAPGVLAMIPDAPMEAPYPGAKPMVLVEDMENREFLAALCAVLYAEVPEGKKKRKQGGINDAEQ